MDYNVYTRKRGKGYQYTVEYKVNDEWKTKSKQGFKKESDAKRAGQALARDLSDFVPAVSNCPTFKEVARLMALDGNKSDGTLYIHKIQFNHLEDLHNKKINDITYQTVMPIIREFQDTHKHSSVVMLRNYGRTVFYYAIKKLKVVNHNPFADVDLPAPKESDERENVVLTLSEIKDLLSTMKGESKLLTAFMGLCGLRIGEARGLKRSSIDLKAGTVTIQKQRSQRGTLGALKTKNSYRVVPLPPTVRSIYLESPIHLDGYVFQKKLSSYNMIKMYERRGYKIRPHDLRHSYTTNCIAQGMDFKTVAALIGDTVKTVFDVYSHVNSDMMERATKILENF